jgi:polyphenol oxidase
MNRMGLREHGGTPFLAFPMLEDTDLVHHGFSVRQGGVSVGPYATMNLSFTLGDARENVLQNYGRMAQALEVNRDGMTSVWQAHTNNVKVVGALDMGKGIMGPKDRSEIDGMVTNLYGVTLVTLHADCLPLYFLDPVNHAIGLAHSGWRGTKQAIGIRTMETMEKAFGSKREDLLVCIGPGIGRSAFEVGMEVVEAFTELLGEERASQVILPLQNGKALLDLTLTNEMLFLEAGVLRDHLVSTDLCTFQRPDLFFSHRRDGSNRGSMAAFLQLQCRNR